MAVTAIRAGGSGQIYSRAFGVETSFFAILFPFQFLGSSNSLLHESCCSRALPILSGFIFSVKVRW